MKIKTTNKQHNRMYSNNIQQRTQHYRVYSNMTRDWFQWFIDSQHCSSTSSPSLSDICRLHLNYLTIQLSSINQSINQSESEPEFEYEFADYSFFTFGDLDLGIGFFSEDDDPDFFKDFFNYWLDDNSTFYFADEEDLWESEFTAELFFIKICSIGWSYCNWFCGCLSSGAILSENNSLTSFIWMLTWTFQSPIDASM